MPDLNPRPSPWVLAGFLLFGGLAVLAGDTPTPVTVDGKINWVYRYEEGKRLSRETGKPLFVVFRCERQTGLLRLRRAGCPSRSRDRPAGRAVRLRANSVDERREYQPFPVRLRPDPGWRSSWTPPTRFYARYGGREDEHAESHLSKKSLARTMRGAGAAPRGEDPVEPVRADRPAAPHARKIPPMRAMIARREVSCIHCHDVKVATLRDLQDRGQFDRSMIFAYPTPRSIGTEVDREAQDVLRKVITCLPPGPG